MVATFEFAFIIKYIALDLVRLFTIQSSELYVLIGTPRNALLAFLYMVQRPCRQGSAAILQLFGYL